MKNKNFLIGLIIIIIILAGWLAWKSYQMPKEVSITTDKTEYVEGETLKITIKNNLAENICFSSCYPYYLEKKNGEWKSYPYGDCKREDIVENCINSNQTKTFEIALSSIEGGLHRIAVPPCINCKIGEEFKESKRFYSSQFTIK